MRYAPVVFDVVGGEAVAGLPDLRHLGVGVDHGLQAALPDAHRVR